MKIKYYYIPIMLLFEDNNVAMYFNKLSDLLDILEHYYRCCKVSNWVN